jgi:hypothetical protein
MIIVFSAHFYPHLCAPRKTFELVTHLKIAMTQAHLTSKFFTVRFLPEKKIYFDSISMLSIQLNLELGFHRTMRGRCSGQPTSKEVEVEHRHVGPMRRERESRRE